MNQFTLQFFRHFAILKQLCLLKNQKMMFGFDIPKRTPYSFLLAAIVAYYLFQIYNVALKPEKCFTGPQIYYQLMPQSLGITNIASESKSAAEYDFSIGLHDFKNMFNWQAAEGLPRVRQLTFLLDTWNFKLRALSLLYFPFHPSLSLTWIFVFLTPLLVFLILKALTQDTVLSLAGLLFVTTLPAVLSGLTFCHVVAKPLCVFIFCLELWFLTKIHARIKDAKAQNLLIISFSIIQFLSFFVDEVSLTFIPIYIIFFHFLGNAKKIKPTLKIASIGAMSAIAYYLIARYVLTAITIKLGYPDPGFYSGKDYFSQLLDFVVPWLKQTGFWGFLRLCINPFGQAIHNQLGGAWNTQNVLLRWITLITWGTIFYLCLAENIQRRFKPLSNWLKLVELSLTLPWIIISLAFLHLWLKLAPFSETFYYGGHFGIMFTIVLFYFFSIFLSKKTIRYGLVPAIFLISFFQFQNFDRINIGWKRTQWENLNPDPQIQMVNKTRALALNPQIPKPIIVDSRRDDHSYPNLIPWVMLRIFEKRGDIQYLN